jgi:hypothetical protein
LIFQRKLDFTQSKLLLFVLFDVFVIMLFGVSLATGYSLLATPDFANDFFAKSGFVYEIHGLLRFGRFDVRIIFDSFVSGARPPRRRLFLNAPPPRCGKTAPSGRPDSAFSKRRTSPCAVL